MRGFGQPQTCTCTRRKVNSVHYRNKAGRASEGQRKSSAMHARWPRAGGVHSGQNNSTSVVFPRQNPMARGQTHARPLLCGNVVWSSSARQSCVDTHRVRTSSRGNRFRFGAFFFGKCINPIVVDGACSAKCQF